jgi:hypothetical protein
MREKINIKTIEDVNYKLLSYPQNQINNYNLVINLRYKGITTGNYLHIRNMIIVEMLTGGKPQIKNKTVETLTGRKRQNKKVKIKLRKDYYIIMMRIDIRRKWEFLYKFSTIIYPQYKNQILRLKKMEKIKKSLGRIHTIKNKVIIYLPMKHFIRFLKIEYGNTMSIFITLWAKFQMENSNKNEQILAFLFASKWGLINLGDKEIIKNYFQIGKDLVKNEGKKLILNRKKKKKKKIIIKRNDRKKQFNNKG